VNESGLTVTSAEQDALMTKVETLARPDDWWVLAGSLPPGATGTIYANVIEKLQAAGANVILDTSHDASTNSLINYYKPVR
jgi:fructose-1-phosphate kinase PfkB-like protein